MGAFSGKATDRTHDCRGGVSRWVLCASEKAYHLSGVTKIWARPPTSRTSSSVSAWLVSSSFQRGPKTSSICVSNRRRDGCGSKLSGSQSHDEEPATGAAGSLKCPLAPTSSSAWPNSPKSPNSSSSSSFPNTSFCVSNPSKLSNRLTVNDAGGKVGYSGEDRETTPGEEVAHTDEPKSSSMAKRGVEFREYERPRMPDLNFCCWCHRSIYSV